jgi:hypothetical protein
VVQAIDSDAQRLFTTAGQGVVKTQALDEAAIATVALVGNDDVVERTGFSTAARKSDDDHDESFGWRGAKIDTSAGLFNPFHCNA